MPIINDRNVVAQARSGTYHTPTYAIAVLQKITPNIKKCQALILTPTRELAQTVQEVITSLGQFMEVKGHAAGAGSPSQRIDFMALRDGRQVVIGTPGRVHDLIQRSFLQTDEIKMLILEDADEILTRGFTNDVYEIISGLPQLRQVILLSTRMHADILQLATKFMPNHIRIMAQTREGELTLGGLPQFFVKVYSEDHKFATLSDVIAKAARFTTFVIFCNHRRSADLLVQNLTANNNAVYATNGEMTKQEQQKVVIRFQSLTHNVLVTSDLGTCARDLWPTHLLINYDLPESSDEYMRRFGQVRRYPFGRNDVAITFVGAEELGKVVELRNFFSTEIVELPANTIDII